MSKRLVYAEDVKEQIDEWLDIVGYVTIGKNLSYYGELLGCIEDAQTVKAKPVEEIYKLNEQDFITHILTTICDYAQINNYEVTDTVKVMGENLVALTEICNFDNWIVKKVE